MPQERGQPQVDPGTNLDSIEQIRAYLAGQYTPTHREPQAEGAPADVSDAGPELFRPINRPPMAIATFLDDGLRQGEMVRIRQAVFRLGREAGDFCIPHDAAISKRHAEVRRVQVQGEWQWFVRDLKSTNGVFTRISQAILQAESQIMLGRTRLAFHPPEKENPSAPPPTATAPPAATQPWQSVDIADPTLFPTLRSINPVDTGFHFALNQPSLKIGSDPEQCDLVINNDPFVAPLHATLQRDDQAQWIIQRVDCVNGLWAKIGAVRVRKLGMFLMGEQMFSLAVL